MSRYRRHNTDYDAYQPDRYGDYEPRYTRREYTGEPHDRRDCKPITRRVGAGRRARIAVETGGPYATALEDARREQRERMELERERAKLERDRNARRKEDMSRPPPPVTHRPSARRYHNSPSPGPDIPMSFGPPPGDESDDGLVADPLPDEGYEQPQSEELFPRSHGDAEGYDFKLPAKTEAKTYAFVEEVSFPLHAESNDSSSKPSKASRNRFNGSVTEVPIAQSRWLGSAYDRGDLGAEISTPETGSAPSEKQQDPLIQWYHLERNMMSFEEFIAAAQSTLQLSEQKRRDVNKLLRDVQRKYEKQRQHGRDLEPDCVSDLFVGDANSKDNACVIFL